MCLSNLTTKKAKTAKEDIICYKTLDKDLYSPYRNHKYELGKDVTSDYPMTVDNIGSIFCGLHSFKTFKDAKTELEIWAIVQFKTIVIYKAIIPKGAEYFEGVSSMFNGGITRGAYASNQLIVLEKVT